MAAPSSVSSNMVRELVKVSNSSCDLSNAVNKIPKLSDDTLERLKVVMKEEKFDALSLSTKKITVIEQDLSKLNKNEAVDTVSKVSSAMYFSLFVALGVTGSPMMALASGALSLAAFLYSDNESYQADLEISKTDVTDALNAMGRFADDKRMDKLVKKLDGNEKALEELAACRKFIKA